MQARVTEPVELPGFQGRVLRRQAPAPGAELAGTRDQSVQRNPHHQYELAHHVSFHPEVLHRARHPQSAGSSPGPDVVRVAVEVASRARPAVTYSVAEMRRVPRLQPPGQFEFDVAGAERVEQTSPSAEQDRDEMDLQLVQ